LVNVTDLYICNLDAVRPIHVIANNLATDHIQKLTPQKWWNAYKLSWRVTWLGSASLSSPCCCRSISNWAIRNCTEMVGILFIYLFCMLHVL